METITANDTEVRECLDIDDIDTEDTSEDLGKEEQKSRFIHLRAKGYSYARIAKELKVSTSTLTNWNQELQEEVSQARAIVNGRVKTSHQCAGQNRPLTPFLIH